MKQEMMGGIRQTICKLLSPCSRDITTPAPYHSIFYRLDFLPDAQPMEFLINQTQEITTHTYGIKCFAEINLYYRYCTSVAHDNNNNCTVQI